MTDPLFDEWQAYGKVVENDYMGHCEFFRVVEEHLRSRFSTPIAILDLGCGDASPILDSLGRLNVQHYCGVDESKEALARARENLSRLRIPFALCQGDLLNEMRRCTDRYDAIVASYSLHHMIDAATKERVLTECRRVLNPGGVLLVIDVFRSEGESRDDYLERWERNAREKFLVLNDAEMTTLVTHIRNHDFPESLSTFRRIGESAGFDSVVALAEDSLNKLVALQSSAE